jgi:hypothetical protein
MMRDQVSGIRCQVIGRVATLWGRWNHWWTRQAPPYPLALFRIALGAFLLLYWGLRLPSVPLLFSQEGIVLAFTDPLPPFLHPLFTPPPLPLAWVLYALLLESLLSLTLGAWTRTSAFLAFLLSSYEWFLSLHLLGGSFDRLFLFSLLILSGSGAGKAYSYDMWRKHRSWLATESASLLPQRLLALQITFTYLGVGSQKLWLPAWKGGEMLYYAMIDQWATDAGFWVAQLGWSMSVWGWLVAITKTFEILMPFGLWIRSVRSIFFIAGTIFHSLIALFLSIWWFLALIPAYILFLEPEQLPRWLHTPPSSRDILPDRTTG